MLWKKLWRVVTSSRRQKHQGERVINPKYTRPRLSDLVMKEAALLRRYIVNDQLILDAGCGDGRNAFRLVDDLAIQPSRIVMMDINARVLEKAEQNIRADEATAYLFEPVLGSIFDVLYPDNTFDAIISLGDVISIAGDGSIEDALWELRRVTKPGGILLFSLVTKEYLLRVAQERNLSDKIREIEATGIYTEWNQKYHEGVFKSWGDISQIGEKVYGLDLELLEMERVYTDYQDIPARVLLACRKVDA